MPAFFAAPRSKVIVFSHPTDAAERAIRQSAKSAFAKRRATLSKPPGARVAVSQIPTYHAHPFCSEPILPRSSNSSVTTIRSRNLTLL
jgi:hypothetical protein